MKWAINIWEGTVHENQEGILKSKENLPNLFE
jgi:hypothetical protein